MAAEPGGRARLFVALELPDEVRRALVVWSGQQLTGLDALRRVRPESLHVTLCFLGARPVAEIDSVAAACRVAAPLPALTLALGEPLWLAPRRPRVLAVSLHDEPRPEGTGPAGLSVLQATLAGALTAGGFYAPEIRPFLGHVTVARVASGRRVVPERLAAPNAMRFVATQVTLFRSCLGAGPARYEALATVVLRGS